MTNLRLSVEQEFQDSARTLNERARRFAGHLYLFCDLKPLPVGGLDPQSASLVRLMNLYRYVNDSNALLRCFWNEWQVWNYEMIDRSWIDDFKNNYLQLWFSIKSTRNYLCHNVNCYSSSYAPVPEFPLVEGGDFCAFNDWLNDAAERSIAIMEGFMIWAESLSPIDRGTLIQLWEELLVLKTGLSVDFAGEVCDFLQNDIRSRADARIILKEYCSANSSQLPNVDPNQTEQFIRGILMKRMNELKKKNIEFTLCSREGGYLLQGKSLLWYFLQYDLRAFVAIRCTKPISGEAEPAGRPFGRRNIIIGEPDQLAGADGPGKEGAAERLAGADEPGKPGASVTDAAIGQVAFYPTHKYEQTDGKSLIQGYLSGKDGNKIAAELSYDHDIAVCGEAALRYYGSKEALIREILNRKEPLPAVYLNPENQNSFSKVRLSFRYTGLDLLELLRGQPAAEALAAPPAEEDPRFAAMPPLPKQSVNVALCSAPDKNGKASAVWTADGRSFTVKVARVPVKMKLAAGSRIAVRLTAVNADEYAAVYVSPEKK